MAKRPENKRYAGKEPPEAAPIEPPPKPITITPEKAQVHAVAAEMNLDDRTLEITFENKNEHPVVSAVTVYFEGMTTEVGKEDEVPGSSRLEIPGRRKVRAVFRLSDASLANLQKLQHNGVTAAQLCVAVQVGDSAPIARLLNVVVPALKQR